MGVSTRTAGQRLVMVEAERGAGRAALVMDAEPRAVTGPGAAPAVACSG